MRHWRRQGWAVLVGLAAVAALAPAAPAAPAGEGPRVLILGFDGMDPLLLRQYLDEGALPNFQRFLDQGATLAPFGTSIPPQSPVAWSNFITGRDPGGHGIFDFIHRDPQTMLPRFSASEASAPEKFWKLGKWKIPRGSGKVKNLRQGTAFWELLPGAGVDATIFKVPANFPPVDCEVRSLSGMGTPDITGKNEITADQSDREIRVARQVGYQKREMLGSMTRSVTNIEADCSDGNNITVLEQSRLERRIQQPLVLPIGTAFGRNQNLDIGQFCELSQSGQIVGMNVSINRGHNCDAGLRRRSQIAIDIPLRVNNDGLAALFAAKQIGMLRKFGVDYLLKDHDLL